MLCTQNYSSTSQRYQASTLLHGSLSAVGVAAWHVHALHVLVSHDITSMSRELFTCAQAMSDWNIKSGDRVLVHAGSSGVGTWVVQTAKVCLVMAYIRFFHCDLG